jgi:zinc and cadmium transporter
MAQKHSGRPAGPERSIVDGLPTPLSASLLAACVTTSGIFVIRHFETWGRRNTTYFAAFAAGVLVSVSLVHIAPTALAKNGHAPILLLAGYLFMLATNRFITAFVCDKPQTAEFAIGLVPLLGIGFHSLIDGVIFSVTFTTDVVTGVLAATGMILHEFPEGIVTYILMLRGGFSKRAAVGLAFTAAALTTPAGTLISLPFMSRIEESVLGALLALSGGALLYVGASHLMPYTEREPRRFSLLALCFGILVALGIIVTHR